MAAADGAVSRRRSSRSRSFAARKASRPLRSINGGSGWPSGLGPAEEAAGFRPVRLVGSAGVAVQLPGGTQLHVPTSDRQALRLVIDTLARADAQRAGGGPC